MVMFRGRLWVSWAAVAGLIVAGYFGWNEFHRPRINVLLITLDTTRADHIGCYGNTAALTPALDSLAKRGVLWECARTPAPLTLPSHSSLFTGLYPAEHGLRTNGMGSLPKSIPTLAERLSTAGYDTAAIVASFVLDRKFGLHRGFEFYDDDQPSVGLKGNTHERQRDGRLVVESALDWLGRPRRRPFFCWVHFYDAHHPYDPRVDVFGEQFKTRPYDGEIAYVDKQVQRLLDYLKERRLDERTLVIVIGDHGEGLGEHDEREHALTLYDQSLLVPWIWAGPGVASGRRVGQPVGLIDFTPTLLDHLGLKSIAGTTGRSLRPGLQGQTVTPGVCYAATDDPLTEHGCSPLRSLSTERWKYIRSTDPELYDLAADPHELHNLASKLPDQLAECESDLVALERRLKPREADAVTLSAKDRQVLSSLGYLGGMSSLPTGKPISLPDIKHRLPIFNAMEDAQELDDSGQSDLAVDRFRELLKTSPDYSLIRLKLADALSRLGKLDEARMELNTVLEKEPENFEAYYRLGGIELAEQHLEAGVAQFERTLHDPPGADELLYVGQLLVHFGQPGRGRSYLERAAAANPELADAYLSLGAIDALAQRPREAMQHYQEALRVNPHSIEAYSNIIKLMGKEGKFTEALPMAGTATRLAPANAELRMLHGTLLMALNRLPEAERELEIALRLDPRQNRAKQYLEQVRAALPQK